jgi:hypothetical protein
VRLERALQLLHLIAGVSYYKAAVPAANAHRGPAARCRHRALLTEMYLNGLGEFAYRNGWTCADGSASRTAGRMVPCADARPAQHALVAIGGGKDSLVSIEALRASAWRRRSRGSAARS